MPITLRHCNAVSNAPRIAFALLALSGSAAPLPSADAAAIMREAFQKTMSRSTRYEGALVRFDPNGRVQRRSRWRLERSGLPGAGRIKVTFLEPAELAGVKLLIHCQPDQAAEQWLYTPATDRVRPVRPDVRGRRFYSTDFSFDDLQEADAALESFRLSGEEEAVGEACWRIEAQAGEGSPYDHKVFWVSKAQNVIVQADHFIGADHVKRLIYRGYQEHAGAWMPSQVDAIDVRMGWRTILVLEDAQVDVAFGEGELDPESLDTP